MTQKAMEDDNINIYDVLIYISGQFGGFNIQTPQELGELLTGGQELGFFQLYEGQNCWAPAIRIKDQAAILRDGPETEGLALMQDADRFVPLSEWGGGSELSFYEDLLREYSEEKLPEGGWHFSLGVTTQAVNQPVPTRAVPTAHENEVRFVPPHGEETYVVRPSLKQVSIDLQEGIVVVGEHTPGFIEEHTYETYEYRSSGRTIGSPTKRRMTKDHAEWAGEHKRPEAWGKVVNKIE